jgi:hypothetical protein
MLRYVMLWCPFNTPASAVGVGGGGFHGIRSVGGGAQPLKHLYRVVDAISRVSWPSGQADADKQKTDTLIQRAYTYNNNTLININL